MRLESIPTEVDAPRRSNAGHSQGGTNFFRDIGDGQRGSAFGSWERRTGGHKNSVSSVCARHTRALATRETFPGEAFDRRFVCRAAAG